MRQRPYRAAVISSSPTKKRAQSLRPAAITTAAILLTSSMGDFIEN